MAAKQTKPKYVVAYGDGWEGLYVDGKLACETHSIKASEMLDIMGIKVNYIEVDQDWLDENGSLPSTLAKVKKSKG